MEMYYSPGFRRPAASENPCSSPEGGLTHRDFLAPAALKEPLLLAAGALTHLRDCRAMRDIPARLRRGDANCHKKSALKLAWHCFFMPVCGE